MSSGSLYTFTICVYSVNPAFIISNPIFSLSLSSRATPRIGSAYSYFSLYFFLIESASFAVSIVVFPTFFCCGPPHALSKTAVTAKTLIHVFKYFFFISISSLMNNKQFFFAFLLIIPLPHPKGYVFYKVFFKYSVRFSLSPFSSVTYQIFPSFSNTA